MPGKFKYILESVFCQDSVFKPFFKVFHHSISPRVFEFNAQALLGIPTLIKDILGGRIFEFLESLRIKGVDIKFLIPEYDVIVPIENIREFFAGCDAVNAAVLVGHTHSTIALTGLLGQ